MPPQQTNLTSETGRDAAGLGLDLSIALVKDAMGEALAAARPDGSIVAPRDALSEKDTVGPPAASTLSVLSLLRIPRHVRFHSDSYRIADIAAGSFRAKPGHHGFCCLKNKSRPKAALQFKSIDRRSGHHQCWL